MGDTSAQVKARGPLLIVVSAPSGAGKTTLCERLLDEFDDIVYSVSCTTRPSRGQERHGDEYFFLSESEFLERQEAKEFLEHASVHGHYYGTLKSTVMDALDQGRSVLMDIDVEGARQIREFVNSTPEDGRLRSALLDIFIQPPSLADLRIRLAARGEDSEDVIERRLAAARKEMSHIGEYMYSVINNDLDQAYAELSEIVLAEGHRRADAG